MDNLKPLLLLAFANDASQYLENLKEESDDIYKIFQDLEEEGRILILRLENAGLDDIRRAIRDNKNHLTIFHYGGHADSQSLRLEDGQGYGKGLARMLGELKDLKLVFLNGCATEDQVQGLLDEGVKAVIATSVSIEDRHACEFSKAFYESFAKNSNLNESYKHACDSLLFKYEDTLPYQFGKRPVTRGFDLNFDSEQPTWILFYSDEHVLSFRGFGVELEKINSDERLIEKINSIGRKIPVNILLAASSAEQLPNGKTSPVNVNNEIALIKEYIFKLFIYSNLKDNFAVNVYQLENLREARHLISSAGETNRHKLIPMPEISGLNLIILIAWHNLGESTARGISPLGWLYKEVYNLPDSQRPGLQLYRRGEPIKIDINHPEKEAVMERYRQVEKFFTDLHGARIIDYHPDLFENEFEHNLRAWMKKYIFSGRFEDAPDGMRESVKQPSRNPYRGLKPYQLNDAPLFFGRINEIDMLRDHLADREHKGLLAVVGASGSGKSSIVRAGLFNRLMLDAIPGSQDWKIIECNISGNVAFELIKLTNNVPELAEANRQFLRWVRQGEAGINNFLEYLNANDPDATKTVLFIDQFEEVFTLIDEKERVLKDQFIDFLTGLAQAKQAQVILTLRSEFYHRCLDYPRLTKLMETGQQPLLPPDSDSIFRIIARPAMFSGLSFQDGLKEEVIKDSGETEGALPLLSYVLEQLYERRFGNQLTLKAYRELGGVVGVIQRQAELAVQIFNTDAPAFKQTFNFVFRKLIAVGSDGVATKKPTVIREKDWPEEALRLVRELRDKRLLITDNNEKGEPVVEIAHEALIRHWNLLKEWILNFKSSLLLMEKVTREAKEWREGRSKKSDEEQQLDFDRNRLWPQYRLNEVYSALSLLGIDLKSKELDESYPGIRTFIRPESERLLAELEYKFVGHRRRAEIGDRLAILTDTRPGVGLKNGLPDIVWCKVPAGRVKINEINEVFELPSFYIAKYPITLEQYQVFEKNHYYNERWWEGLSTTPQENKPYPQPSDNLTNRPYEFVNWYQAMAYSQWLSVALGYEVRLPYEWEWQQAACNGNTDYLYPWGSEWNPNLANTNDSSCVGHLVAVGLYPEGKSVNGAMDMSGNAYEWCKNAFEDIRIRSSKITDGIEITSRGGGWIKVGKPAEECSKVSFRFRDLPTGENANGNRTRVCFRLMAEKVPV
ncbi:MAG: SUMF1/EgtB/PvdO family nonheme iron enzyme [Phaeodactylibacter sp.]|nr:SUMF1/EgtB/PvdO family nonheme iron enzyme [Phaeodactylibacter sp.]